MKFADKYMELENINWVKQPRIKYALSYFVDHSSESLHMIILFGVLE